MGWRIARGRWVAGLFAAALGMLLLAGTGALLAAEAADKPLEAVATTGIVADLVRAVGGEHVRVTALMGPGVDPHLYKASFGDTQKLAQAGIVFYNGLHLEGKMIDILERMGRRKPTYAVTDAVPRHMLRQPPEFEGQYDPHIWFDVRLWMHAVDGVRDVLAEVDPAHRDAYEANAAAYRAELEALDRYVRERVAEIPPERRVLVTAHDAFGYFGDAYGVEVLGLQGISTATEYGLKDVQALVDTLVERGIKAVFVEASVSPRAIEAVVSGARARGHMVSIGGTLYSDSLGDADGPAGTYVGMVRHNVDTLVEALK